MSAVVSGTYNFGNSQSENIIYDSFERVGILPDEIVGQKIQSAQRSLNLLLSEWINRGLNLWTVQQSMIGLNPNQNAYTLPTHTSDVLEATIRTSQRQLGGIPASSAGGVAANAFDGNPATACTQNAPNGNISYDYGVGNSRVIQMFGIQSNVTINYTIAFEYSADNITWVNLITEEIQSYPIGQIIWFVVPVPVPARYFRIRETGGSTLNVQEVYFNTTINDTIITRISRSEYISYPVKNQTGRPTSFWLNRQITPVIYLWPTPIAPYNNLFITTTSMIQDMGRLTNLTPIPQRFYEAICACLAVKLAIKYKPVVELIAILKAEAKESFSIAASEDTEKVPLRIYGAYDSGWTSS